MNVLLGNVTAEPFVKIIVPVPPKITPVERVIEPLRDSVPEPIFINPVDKSMPPVFVKVKVLKFKVCAFRANVPLTAIFDPNVTLAVPFKVKLFTALVVPFVAWLINNVFVFDP